MSLFYCYVDCSLVIQNLGRFCRKISVYCPSKGSTLGAVLGKYRAQLNIASKVNKYILVAHLFKELLVSCIRN